MTPGLFLGFLAFENLGLVYIPDFCCKKRLENAKKPYNSMAYFYNTTQLEIIIFVSPRPRQPW
jgi:hypothetical protein